MITGQVRLLNGLPSFPKVGLRPQNVIPCESKIVQACKEGDIHKIREILVARQAHPNDRTPEDLTVFRVRCLRFSLKGY